MLTNRLRPYRPASSRGGFTLVELLVVIGIIAILAGVALGPITAGIQKAKQNGGLQEAHVLGLAMYSAANDNNQTYPDKSGGGADAGYMAQQLLAGGYINDASIFSLSGDTAKTALTSSNNTATTIQKAEVCWDFSCTSGGTGLSSTSDTYWPIVWSTVNGGTSPNGSTAASANTDVYAKPNTNGANPFGTAGIAVFYINNSAAFIPCKLVGTTTLEADVVTAAQNLNGSPTNVATASGT